MYTARQQSLTLISRLRTQESFLMKIKSLLLCMIAYPPHNRFTAYRYHLKMDTKYSLRTWSQTNERINLIQPRPQQDLGPWILCRAVLCCEVLSWVVVRVGLRFVIHEIKQHRKTRVVAHLCWCAVSLLTRCPACRWCWCSGAPDWASGNRWT